MNDGARNCRGLTLVELLVAVAIGAVLMLALGGVAGQAVKTHDAVRGRALITADARFALDQIVGIASRSPSLLLPLADNPATDWPENIREQTVPASAPVGSSTLATAVLAVRIPVDQDLNADGFADADNDRDGRVDEDIPSDATRDNASGIRGIDDDGDGSVDEYSLLYVDDDEDGRLDEEDYLDGTDDDGDGSVGEDPGSDNNRDGKAGIADVDDDGDGTIDEGGLLGFLNDDEDGSSDEDWIDPLVFYLNGDQLIQRTPVPWDQDGSGSVDGRDYVQTVIAEHVTAFRVERVAGVGQLVDVQLRVTDPATGDSVSLGTRIRVGGAL